MGRHSLELKKSRHYFLATSKSSKMVKIINILGLALVGAAAANEPLARKDVKQLFKSADSNADRQLDLAELAAAFSTASEEEVDQIMAAGDKNRAWGWFSKLVTKTVVQGVGGWVFGNGE